MLDAAGIDRSGVVVSADPSDRRAVITVDERGENTIVVVPGANAEVVAVDAPRRAASCWPSSRSR